MNKIQDLKMVITVCSYSVLLSKVNKGVVKHYGGGGGGWLNYFGEHRRTTNVIKIHGGGKFEEILSEMCLSILQHDRAIWGPQSLFMHSRQIMKMFCVQGRPVKLFTITKDFNIPPHRKCYKPCRNYPYWSASSVQMTTGCCDYIYDDVIQSRHHQLHWWSPRVWLAKVSARF